MTDGLPKYAVVGFHNDLRAPEVFRGEGVAGWIVATANDAEVARQVALAMSGDPECVERGDSYRALEFPFSDIPVATRMLAEFRAASRRRTSVLMGRTRNRHTRLIMKARALVREVSVILETGRGSAATTAPQATPSTPVSTFRLDETKNVPETVLRFFEPGGNPVEHRIRGSTRSRVALEVLRSAGSTVVWFNLLKQGHHAGWWKITGQDTLYRNGREIKKGLPDRLRGFWSHSAHSVTWKDPNWHEEALEQGG